jgi:hypothetical protein
MKIIAISLLSLFFVAAGSADLLIMQEQEQLYIGGTNRMKTTIKVKGKKVRVDLDFPPMSTVNDQATGNTIFISHYDKTYQEVTLGKMKESAEEVAENLEDGGKITDKRPRLHATGKHDVVNGWKVDEYVADSKSMHATYWIAKGSLDLNAILVKNLAEPMHQRMDEQFPDPKLFPGVPVLIILEQETQMGRVKTTIRTQKIEVTKIEDSDFLVPQGYKKQ